METKTHRGTFYGIPIYLDMTDDECPEVEGTNKFFDYLFTAAAVFHNVVIERAAQFLAALTGRDYEPCFPFRVKKMPEQ